jgi:hypothetical protein
MTVSRVDIQTNLLTSSVQTCVHKKEEATNQKVSRIFSIIADGLRSTAWACVGFALLSSIIAPLNGAAFLTAGAIAFIASATLDTASHLLRLQQF